MKYGWKFIIITSIILIFIMSTFFYKSPVTKYDIKIYNDTNYPIMRYHRVEVIQNTYNSLIIKQNNIVIVILKNEKFKMELVCLN